MKLNAKIEAILFVASKPLSAKQIAKSLDVAVDKVEDALETLRLKYNGDDSGINILSVENKVQMATNPDAKDCCTDDFIKDQVSGELTKAQLETLTVVAYRGPVTRPELEQIRGVNCALILRNLLIRGLIDERSEKKDVLPKYTVSFDALSHLGIKTVSELPEYDELHKHEHLEQALLE